MANRKIPLSPETYPWRNGDSSFGEIVVGMVLELATMPNQLSAGFKKAEIIRYIDASHAEDCAYQKFRDLQNAAKKKAGKATKAIVAEIRDSLLAKGIKVTARAIAQEWARRGIPDLVSNQQICKYLREISETT